MVWHFGATQGDVNSAWSLQFFPSGWQGAAHVAVNAVPLLVLAVLWWWLADAVAQSRRHEVFTVASSRKLTTAGAVVALGGPLLAFATWSLHRWMLDASQFADRAEDHQGKAGREDADGAGGDVTRARRSCG